MHESTPIVRVARVTLETTSPLSIASGTRDGFFDVSLVKDALGLPAIPGTSLTGVLRQAFAASGATPEDASNIFGRGGEDSRMSRLAVTWGRIHDSKDQPVDGLPFQRDFAGLEGEPDPILSPLLILEPAHRDHVRLSHKGSPALRGKFDRAFVPAGHRFTFGLMLHDDVAGTHAQSWQRLLECLGSPGFRLGGATRRGYGGCRVQRLMTGQFDLSLAEGLAAFAKLSSRLDDNSGLTEAIAPAGEGVATRFELAAEDFWRIGGVRGPARRRHDKPADDLIYHEQRVVWEGSRGTLAPPGLVVPASSIKGALSHRLAFHYNRLCGVFADTLDRNSGDSHVGDANLAVRVLLGYVTKDAGRIGALVIEDGAVTGHDRTDQTAWIAHNSIDRFTGGVRNHVLFSEEALYGGAIHIGLWLDPSRLRVNLSSESATGEEQRIRQSLEAALADLGAGRLAIGAGMSKGLGYFRAMNGGSPENLWKGAQA